jgi:hypothetical protein
MDTTIPRTAKPPAGKAEVKALVRTPEKLDPVSVLIKKLFPDYAFMVVVWMPLAGSKTVVEMITNCGLDEVAGVLRETAGHMEQNSELNKVPQARGQA